MNYIRIIMFVCTKQVKFLNISIESNFLLFFPSQREVKFVNIFSIHNFLK